MGKISNFFFRRKLEKLGFDMSKGSENERIATALNERGLGGNHFVKCMEDAIATKNLQRVCEIVSGRKEAGRYLQRKLIVIQCHSCQENFATKEGVDFAGATINLESLENIIKHLTSCDGVLCDCGNKVLYFEKCKKCGLKWDERSAHLKDINPDCITKKQKKQIEIYKKKYLKEVKQDGTD
jgi:hypothetical protein